MPTILLAEDEAAIAETVLYALRADGYEAEHVLLGGSVLPRLKRGGIDLVILDVGLPDRSGFDVCRDLREASAVPVIFLTARSDEIDLVLGLELGADDYMTKPFSPRELVARVRARLRRAVRCPAASAPRPGRRRRPTSRTPRTAPPSPARRGTAAGREYSPARTVPAGTVR